MTSPVRFQYQPEIRLCAPLQAIPNHGDNMTSSALDTINSLLSPLGLKVTHSVEDIYFVEHNLFLIIESTEDQMFLLCFNRECPPDKAALAALTIYAQAEELGLDLGLSGSYLLEEMPGQEIKLHFHPQQTVKGDMGGNGMTH